MPTDGDQGREACAGSCGATKSGAAPRLLQLALWRSGRLGLPRCTTDAETGPVTLFRRNSVQDGRINRYVRAPAGRGKRSCRRRGTIVGFTTERASSIWYRLHDVGAWCSLTIPDFSVVRSIASRIADYARVRILNPLTSGKEVLAPAGPHHVVTNVDNSKKPHRGNAGSVTPGGAPGGERAVVHQPRCPIRRRISARYWFVLAGVRVSGPGRSAASPAAWLLERPVARVS
jgi:hypothetical protein